MVTMSPPTCTRETPWWPWAARRKRGRFTNEASPPAFARATVERPVEVAVFQRGELQALRTLSPRRERRMAILAASSSAAVVLLAMAATAALVSSMGLIVHAPTFLVSWLGVAGGVALIS